MIESILLWVYLTSVLSPNFRVLVKKKVVTTEVTQIALLVFQVFGYFLAAI